MYLERRDQGREEAEPEVGEGGQEGAFMGDAISQDLRRACVNLLYI